MATSTLANQLTLEMALGDVHFDSDTFRGVLMDTGFTFDQDADDVWADVSASELSAGNGYSTGGNVLSGVSVTRSGNTTTITWDSTSWTASGGSIGPTPGLMLYDDTHASKTLIGYIDFGGDETATTGNQIGANNLSVDLVN